MNIIVAFFVSVSCIAAQLYNTEGNLNHGYMSVKTNDSFTQRRTVKVSGYDAEQNILFQTKHEYKSNKIIGGDERSKICCIQQL